MTHISAEFMMMIYDLRIDNSFCLRSQSLSLLSDLSSNHTVIVFDNRGVGNTTTGNKPFSILQFANDTAGLLDALKIQKADVLGYSLGS